MILKGIPYLIKREGSLSKYLMFTEILLDNNKALVEEKPTFKRHIAALKNKVLYFETYDIEEYSKKECWVVFDTFEVKTKSLYEEASRDGSSILPTLLEYIKTEIDVNFSITEDTEKIGKRDLYFYSVYPRGVFMNKTEEEIESGLIEIKQTDKILYTCDYINYDIKGFSEKIIRGVIKYIGVEEYLKYIFNNITCIYMKSNKNLVGSIADYNIQVEEEFLKRSPTLKDKYFSLGQEIDYVLQEDNFNFNRDKLIEVILINPFTFSLIFESANSIVPIFFMEVILSFVIKELINLTGNEELQTEYATLLHKVYLLYVFKTLQNGRTIPDTTSLGKTLPSETQLVPGSSLLAVEDVIESLRYIIKVREFMMNAEGDFISLRSAFNTNINVLPSIIKNYSSTLKIEPQLKDLIKNLDVLCHIENDYICLKSDYKLNQFLQSFVKRVSKQTTSDKYSYLLDTMNTFTKDQTAAMINLIYKNILVLSGRPGTGKTYTITKFVSNIIDKTDKEEEAPLFLLLSFTNKAVNKLNEYIMNNLYSDRDIKELLSKQEDEKNKIKLLNNHKNLWVSTIDLFVWEVMSSQNKNLLAKLEKADRLFIIIDEIGMVSLDKFNLLISTLINLYGDEKFYQLLEKTVFSGDYAQLISIGIGDFFGDLLTILPMVDLKESVRFGKDKELSKFFETIRQMRFEIKDRQIAKDYLLAIKKVGKDEDNIIINPVDDSLVKGDLYYGTQQECIDYSYRFIYRIIEDLCKAVLKKEINVDKFLSTNADSSSKVGSFFKGKKEKLYTPLFKLTEKKKEFDINKILIDLFIKNSHKFKIITQYRKEQSILEEYFISSSTRLNKLILFILLGMRFYDDKHNIKTNTNIEIVHSIPEKQYLNASDDKKIEINEAINHFISIEDSASLKRFISEVDFKKIFLIRDVPYLIKSRRLRKYGLNIGDFIHFKGVSKIDGEKYLKFVKYTGDIQDFYDIPINRITIRDIGLAWACNIHQLQGDEFPFVVVPFLGALYQNPTPKETVSRRNLRRFDSRALYTSLTRVKLSKNEGKLIVYFGHQYLNVLEEAEIVLRDTPFRLLVKT